MLEPQVIRKIIHVDMDAFYASVEQMDFPELKGKPVAVGGSEQRGVVSAASYEARKFGVCSAMSGVLAAKKCPQLIFVRPRFERYKEISQQIRAIFLDYTDLVEPLSLDEAFLDVTENKKEIRSATLLAAEIRQRIKEEVGLTASAGISINKFTAKIASDVNKPNGQLTITPNEVEGFLEALPIERFFGVGKVTAEKMKSQGIFTGKHLKAKSLEYLVLNYGKQGKHLFDVVRGIHLGEVKPNRIRKSIAAERTYGNDLIATRPILEALDRIADELERRMEKSNTKGRTITLKLKYHDFTLQTRSKTVPIAISLKKDFFEVVEELLRQEPLAKPIRLLGIAFSKLDNEKIVKEEPLQLTIDF